jgi:hypothetical protein
MSSCFKNKSRGLGVAQVVESLSSKYKTLSSTSQYHQKKRKQDVTRPPSPKKKKKGQLNQKLAGVPAFL